MGFSVADDAASGLGALQALVNSNRIGIMYRDMEESINSYQSTSIAQKEQMEKRALIVRF
jgi:hypothetical protein